MRQVVFDLETTGFKFAEGHRIVEMGAVEMVNGALSGRTFHTYVNPERDVPRGAYEVHGLSAEFLKDKPVFNDASVAAGFLDFIGDAQLVAHNGVAFDLPFLQAELKAAQLPRIENDVFDTLIFARRKFPGAPASLDALCSRFGVDTRERERDGHGALLDSRLLAEVYIELTGGAQANLSFGGGGATADVGPAGFRGAPKKRAAARQRPSALPSRLTQDERAAHEAFVEELGEDCLWRQSQPT
ncbi:MAG: DNA polymerase III subunit epsilon [Pseudomonadota bacterium]